MEKGVKETRLDHQPKKFTYERNRDALKKMEHFYGHLQPKYHSFQFFSAISQLAIKNTNHSYRLL